MPQLKIGQDRSEIYTNRTVSGLSFIAYLAKNPALAGLGAFWAGGQGNQQARILWDSITLDVQLKQNGVTRYLYNGHLGKYLTCANYFGSSYRASRDDDEFEGMGSDIITLPVNLPFPAIIKLSGSDTLTVKLTSARTAVELAGTVPTFEPISIAGASLTRVSAQGGAPYADVNSSDTYIDFDVEDAPAGSVQLNTFSCVIFQPTDAGISLDKDLGDDIVEIHAICNRWRSPYSLQGYLTSPQLNLYSSLQLTGNGGFKNSWNSAETISRTFDNFQTRAAAAERHGHLVLYRDYSKDLDGARLGISFVNEEYSRTKYFFVYYVQMRSDAPTLLKADREITKQQADREQKIKEQTLPKDRHLLAALEA